MFDITSWIRETIFRRPKLQSMPLSGEELTEKQTTKLGYFLLGCMFLAIIISAEWSLNIIQDIPTPPTRIPYCVSNMVNTFDSDTEYYRTNYSNDCTLISDIPYFDFTQSYNTLLPTFKSLQDRKENLSRLQSQKRDAEYDKEKRQEEYTVALTEKIANESSTAYNSKSQKERIQSLNEDIAGLEQDIAGEISEIGKIQTGSHAQVSLLKLQLNQAEAAYKQAYLWYRLMIAVLSFIFSLLIFVLVYRFYVREKIKNSPHTIIFSVATFAYGLIIIQISATFIWDVIPHRFLEFFLGWISLFTPLLFLVQFLWPVFIIAIFGFLVYRIQKRLYSPMNILKRFIADKKCPSCGNSVDTSKPYCPLCSHEIQIPCSHCGTLTVKGMPYCSHCGKGL